MTAHAPWVDQRRALVRAHPSLKGLERARIDRTGPDAFEVRLSFLTSEHADKPAIPDLAPDDVDIGHGSAATGASKALSLKRINATTLQAVFPPLAVLTQGVDFESLTVTLRERADLDPLCRTAGVLLAARPSDRHPIAALAPVDDSDVDYLARDYEDFRRLMLDQMTILVPKWTERNPADMGVAMIEALAYAADHLSYFQDAVGTEAYLSTARRRVSVRRHAKLLDLHPADGCAARTWIRVQVDQPCRIARGLRVLGRSTPTVDGRTLVFGPDDSETALGFETLVDAELTPEHDSFVLHDWGVDDFAIEVGETQAALVGSFPALQEGDVLILARAAGALEDGHGEEQRLAVRLAAPPRIRHDPLTGTWLTEIRWSAADAPRRRLIISMLSDGVRHKGLTQAWGNIIPAEAGLTFVEPDVQTPVLAQERDGRAAASASSAGMILSRTDLVCAVPYNDETARRRPARELGLVVARDAVHSIVVTEEGDDGPGPIWSPLPDLLGSGRFTRGFVVEIEQDGVTRLRFGDNQNGRRPRAGVALRARYRVGQMDLKLGADRLGDWEPRIGDEAVIAVSNPLATEGGQARTSTEEIRLAPRVFREARRCVVPDDFAAAALEDPDVQGAMAQTIETGSASVIRVRICPRGGGAPSNALLDRLRAQLEALRMIGTQIELTGPSFVPLTIALKVGVAPPHAPAQVAHAVQARIRALFAPDRMCFGRAADLGPILAAAMSEPGVRDVRAEILDRWPGRERVLQSVEIQPHEIALGDDLATAVGRGEIRVNAEVAS